ncbi:NlpC/P60 family protein [uncultured Desulfuromusa sp.]|uniref:NlpC/P60 family protein n=1 Tax=uncultured Desulfuromusa sp. TaxID=219183 RepID=UPI002AA95DA5|nr:NlpC/P60 family protein [uncultured Desulfuromusa sp.]
MTASACVNVSVSNHYREPSSTSEVVTQGLLGEQLEVLEEHPTHLHVRQADGYESWVPEDLVTFMPKPQGEKILVRSHFMRIYEHPNIQSMALREAVIGSTLTSIDEQEDWFRIVLPDGTLGWAEKCHFGTFPEGTGANILNLAREFLGYSYFWGGRTPKGFDCSGFVQTVFQLHGVILPRDSWQQQQLNLLSTNHLDARPGDLLFFSSVPDKVTHVAISLGDQQYIHASGWVSLDSFRETDTFFTRQRLNHFTSVNRFLS